MVTMATASLRSELVTSAGRRVRHFNLLVISGCISSKGIAKRGGNIPLSPAGRVGGSQARRGARRGSRSVPTPAAPDHIPGCLSCPSSRTHPRCTAADLTLEEIIPSGYRGRESRIENEGLGRFWVFFYLNQHRLHSVSDQIRIS